MRGIEKQEKGLLTQAVEDLLNLIEISVESNVSPQKTKKTPAYTEKKIQLLTSVYCIYNNEIYDLLSKQKINVFSFFFFIIFCKIESDSKNLESRLKKITNYEIRFLSEFKNLYRLAMNNQKSMVSQTKDNEFQKNCHVIINFSLKNLQKNDSR